MPSVQSLVQDNRILRNKLKAGLDDRKYPIDGQLWPLVYLGVKILRHEESLELLTDRGFGSEAGIILRTMFEAAVNIMWLLKDVKTIEQLVPKLKRYNDYQFVATQKYRDYARNSSITEVLPDKVREELNKMNDTLDEKARQVQDEYEFNAFKPWSGRTIKQMANDVGWGERYDTLYQIYSDIVHSGVNSVQEYLVFDDKGKVRVNYQSQTNHCKGCLLEGKTYLLTAFAFLDIFLDLKLEKLIDDSFPNKHFRINPPLLLL
jgi:hypothetical protein